MADRSSAIKAEVIDSVATLVSERLEPSEAACAQRFVRAYFRDVAPGDLIGTEPLDLYGAALAHLRYGQHRAPGQHLVRVYNPAVEQHGWQSRHTVAEIVNDDMPFLVDSVGMELNRRGLGVHLTIHPVVKAARDADGRITGLEGEAGSPESFIHVEIDRLSDPKALDEVDSGLTAILADVRLAVTDWQPMLAKIAIAITGLEPAAHHVEPAELEELTAFLRWLENRHFTFLGYIQHELVPTPEGPQLRRVRGEALGLLRGLGTGSSESFADLPAAVREVARDPRLALLITKGDTRSTVHRATLLDVISVKRYGPAGEVLGEHRFVGLFTSAAYSLSPHHIPLLRRKVQAVQRRAGYPPSGHAGKALANILESFPRDELFQISTDELAATAAGIQQLQERQRLRLFLRRDPFGRFVTALVFVPRERYTTTLRERMQAILESALGAGQSEFQVHLAESVLARIFFLVRTPDGPPAELDAEDIERRLLAATQTWGDLLKAALVETVGEAEGHRLYRNYGRAFPSGYQELVAARAAVPDILQFDRLARGEGPPLAMSLFRKLEESDETVHFKVIHADGAIPLSEALPILERMGLRVLTEHPFEVRGRDGHLFAIHDFTMRPSTAAALDVELLRPAFQEAFLAIWSQAAENDGFNRLVVAAGLAVRRVVILRAYCKYLLQLGIPFSQAYIENALVQNAEIARQLIELFEARFDPGRSDRELAVHELTAAISHLLDEVASLDDDRILRSYLGLIQATLRTNAYQADPATGRLKDYVSFKFDSKAVPGMPLPRPLYEIWVYAPQVEAVHLRGGKVARGGIRWSDRREDFRTEVLGLMKAQMVKNSVIVPVGAKGGFFVKRPPAGTDRGAQQEEAIRCYRLFLAGLLDVTDNRLPDGIVTPPQVIRYDDDDPYLVVAADKGTATFSDIANGIAQAYGFWLDDAFASGGSAGYDHKGMGITARGAWESVRRHFREQGRDPAIDLFTCVGVGDMSGDVFGNGMLLSDKIKLVAAFDHRHIFLDPDPDPATSFAERQRLFALPRSSWGDYDKTKLSAGGGIYPRTLKAIPLSQPVQRVLGLNAAQATPFEVIHSILEASVDLLWNGGIGTYVKATRETQADAHDRANDPVRADGARLRARIVGEGGNLGLTQPGRIEYAARGGRINTDFIDNSAGVDCSDHEVNIKILLNEVVATGDLTIKQRDQILAEMTDEVGLLVLRDNILQNIALSMSQRLGVGLLDAEQRQIRKLERAGQLDRVIEMLPGDEELAERRREGRGLTRPETAVLLAYAKMTLYERILASTLPDRSYFIDDLHKYFPRLLRRRFAEAIERHRLRREIVATLLANSVVNRGLHVFVSELEDETGAGLEDLVLAYVVTRDAFRLLPLHAAIEALPTSVPAELQLSLFLETREVLAAGSRWFLAHAQRPITIRECVGKFRPGITAVIEGLEGVLAQGQSAELGRRLGSLVDAGIEPATARALAVMAYLPAAADIVRVADEAQARGLAAETMPIKAAPVYFALHEALRLGWLTERIRAMPTRSRWDRIALTSLEEQMASALRELALRLVGAGVGGDADVAAAVQGFLEREVPAYRAHQELLLELIAIGEPDLAMLSVAIRHLAKLASGRT